MRNNTQKTKMPVMTLLTVTFDNKLFYLHAPAVLTAPPQRETIHLLHPSTFMCASSNSGRRSASEGSIDHYRGLPAYSPRSSPCSSPVASSHVQLQITAGYFFTSTSSSPDGPVSPSLTPTQATPESRSPGSPCRSVAEALQCLSQSDWRSGKSRQMNKQACRRHR